MWGREEKRKGAVKLKSRDTFVPNALVAAAFQPDRSNVQGCGTAAPKGRGYRALGVIRVMFIPTVNFPIRLSYPRQKSKSIPLAQEVSRSPK